MKFKNGDVVVFEPKNFNKKYWAELSEKDRIRYYGPLGYGRKKPKLFIYMTNINAMENGKRYDTCHCVLLDMDDGHLEYND